MLQALRSNRARQPVVRSASTPAPVGGWNARDGLANMSQEDAIVLDNFFPSTSSVDLRKGFSSHATGVGAGAVETLLSYNSGSARKLLAIGDGGIYDATSAGAVGAALATGLSSDRWQYVNFGTSAGQYLVMVNGSDACRKYDGSTISTNAITNASLSSDADLIDVNVFKERLFFVEKNKLVYYYLSVGTLAGAASRVDLSSLFRLGGSLRTMVTWTRDGGSGLDDYAVFITSEGEVAVYQGTNPADSNAWALVGIFRIGAPVGQRCAFKIGADVVIITRDGFVQLSRAIAEARTKPQASLSDKIGNAVALAVQDYGNNFGWQPILYPRSGMALFNVPVTENATAHQYVVNTITGAWCRFKGINANCWALSNDRLYFGGAGGVVYLADDGVSDAGTNIVGEAKTAFTYFGARGRLKRFLMARPMLIADGDIPVAVEINVDYQDAPPSAVPSVTPVSGDEWGTAEWGTAEWNSSDAVRRDWVSVTGIGMSAAMRIYVESNEASVLQWHACDWTYELGGIL